MAYYYPEGYFGPICDAGIDDFTLQSLQRTAQVEDERVTVFDANLPSDYITLLDEPVLIRTKCRQREDGTFYDCVDEWINPQDAWDDWARCLDPNGACYPWRDVSTKNFRLEQDFFVPNLGPDSCSPFDSDINIREQSYYQADGTLITYGKIEKSSPVTFPVTSTTESVVSSSTISASFNGSGDLVVTGTGEGIVQLSFEWDDNPSSYGQALGTYSISSLGISFTQTVGVTTGSDSASVQVTPGTYSSLISGGSGYDGFDVQNDGTKLCFKDLDGNDCNATLRITDVLSLETSTNAGYWSELGNSYAVWVNPEVCTLPQQQQEVTYIVPITATDLYAFEFGCDDTAQLFLFDETIPFMDIQGGIFSAGPLSTPYVSTRTLNAGTNLKMTVRCTNSDAGFVNSEGEPTGLAFSWQRNPGGWFIRICRGGGCATGNNIDWVKSGPWGTWSNLLNTYGVWPSNTSPYPGSVQTTTWNVTIPSTGNYDLTVSQDDQCEYFLDGVSLGTRYGWAEESVSSFTLTNLSTGNHTIGVAGLNVTNSAGTGASWADNPAGVAWTLSANGVIITSSLDLNTSGDGNLIWTTRDATGYDYYEVTQN
ncbi:hypothetical protein RW060613_216 [Synechococcus phage S-RIM8]|uniref:PA14 domain-containing protein n=1 Tax=Synechococcus phage S-RIM8 TaxID=756278 RepID=A0A1D7SB24_9CAUD|nr:hypothetical protein RW060613_216 [Synechococcus phage S-RIM8]AOO11469.1 hypothetical protein RW251112_216 [Synechococcus phage S-RIM8]QBQ75763.1 hypothetical protein RW220214_215 [Synechococcus phage S-RIM8]QBQ75984.1 hypothetical protein RW620316_216 [Synechococcus phage S-RIM8]